MSPNFNGVTLTNFNCDDKDARVMCFTKSHSFHLSTEKGFVCMDVYVMLQFPSPLMTFSELRNPSF